MAFPEMGEMVFLTVAALTVVPAFLVAFSRNLLHSAFALFFTFFGTSGLYFFLDAEFLAVVQIIVYIGGVSVILLFAILLTKNVDEIRRTNAIAGARGTVAAGAALILFGAMTFVFIHQGAVASADAPAASAGKVTLEGLGDLLLNKYLFPFEAVSILLLAVLIGSLVIARRAVK